MNKIKWKNIVITLLIGFSISMMFNLYNRNLENNKLRAQIVEINVEVDKLQNVNELLRSDIHLLRSQLAYEMDKNRLGDEPSQ